MPEPRRWTLHGATDDLDGQGMPIRLAAYCDPLLRDGECVRVIEAAPVEAELERLRSQIEFWRRRYETQHGMVHAMEDEIARLRRVERMAMDACAAEFTCERLTAMNALRDALETTTCDAPTGRSHNREAGTMTPQRALFECLLLSGADVSNYGHETRTEEGREATFREWARCGSAEEVVDAVRQLRNDHDGEKR